MSELPKVAKCGAYEMIVEEGKMYAWCTCGLSSKQPLCDGAHKGTEFRSQKFVAKESGTVYLCGCKFSKDKPFCDGSHMSLER